MAMNLLNTSSIAKEMQTKVTERMGDWLKQSLKLRQMLQAEGLD